MQVRAVGVYGGPFHTAAGSILCLSPCSKAALLGKVRRVPQIEKKRRSERNAVLKKSFDSLFYALGNTFFLPESFSRGKRRERAVIKKPMDQRVPKRRTKFLTAPCSFDGCRMAK